MKRGSWFSTRAEASGIHGLLPETLEELARLDEKLYRIWNLGDFTFRFGGNAIERGLRFDTLDFVENTRTTRALYNAKINIHRDKAEPIYLGIRGEDLAAFDTAKVESLSRDAEETGSFIVRP